MNTLTVFNSSENERTAPPRSIELTPGTNAWYQSYEMGMAFCRLTEQLSSKAGTKVEKELRCLARALEKKASEFCRQKKIKLIDLGTGDGQKMVVVIEALKEAGVQSVRYIPVNTNPYISRYAIFTILGSGKKAWNQQEVELLFGPLDYVDSISAPNSDSIPIEALVHLSRFHPATSDVVVKKKVTVPTTGLQIDFFENLREVVSAARTLTGEGMSIFCLLGNTFGNYSAEKRNAFLRSSYAEMEAGDLFLLGIGLRPQAGVFYRDQVRFLEREYLPGEAFMRLGADHPRSQYISKYDPESHCMIHSFERPDRSIQHMGYSYLFDPQEVVMDLELAGFEIVWNEFYPGLTDNKTPPQDEYEPKCLTLLARRSQGRRTTNEP
jgi:hypothetical protein